MKFTSNTFTLLCILIINTLSLHVTWAEIPSLRAGQVDSVQSLMTSEDTNPSITDQTISFINPMSSAALGNLKAGVSLLSYESWMTDTFSYNITVTSFDNTAITVRFQVLDNTFFSSAKVHYIVLWRTSSPDNGPSGTYNLQVIFGCYLTSNLLTGTGLRNTTVGNLAAQISNSTDIVVKSMIAGMKMSNSVGVNNYIDVTTTYATGSNLLQHLVIVQNNCFLEFVCLTSIVLDTNVGANFDIDLVQFRSYVLTATNSGLTTLPYMERFDGISRMFFGFSRINVSMSDTRYLNVQTANISLVSLLYDKNTAMNEVIYNMFFFALRSCPNSTYFLYNPDTYDCDSSCPTHGYFITGTAPNQFCMPCHYSCLDCSLGNSISSCTSCNTNNSRIASPVGGYCNCIVGFSDSGVALCAACNATLYGCSTCSSPSVCLTCLDTTIYYLNSLTDKCECLNGTYMASGYCLSYPGCLVATKFINNISCDSCDKSKNFTIQNDSTCSCTIGFQLNMTVSPPVCYHNCGNGITPVGDGLCDDGNTNSSDGCSSSCTIQSGYHCTYSIVGNISGISTCTLKTNVVITYLYTQRIIDSNHFIMAFSLSPSSSGLNSESFKTNFITTLPISSSSVTYDPSSQTIYLEGNYDSSIQGTIQTANVTFDNMPFYADPISITFTAIGSNAQLVIQTYNAPNKILSYIVIGMAVYAILLAIFSAVVGLKLVGIELLVPVQLIYFSLATLPNHSTYSFILSNLKYANGFSGIRPYDYLRTSSQSRNLVGINYQTQFLLSINFMLLIYILILLWLMVHHFRLKYKQHKLQQFLLAHTPEQQIRSHDSEQDKDQDEENIKLARAKPQNQQIQQKQSKLREDHHLSFKVFTFEVDRIYFIFYLILLNQMLFAFIVMTLNVPIKTFLFPQQINVLVCNFIFFIYIGNIVFISYDQESNKMISFTSISDRYAYVYFLIDFIIMVVLSLTFQLTFSIYLVTVLSLTFIVLIIKQRPYSSTLLTFENVVALYLHIILVISLVLICVLRSIPSVQRQQLFLSYLILAFIFIGQILTTIRVVVKVNFKKAFDDLKNPNSEDNSDKKAKKIIQKDLDLLQKQNRMQIIPPDSVRNGLLTPRDKIVDWQSKNSDDYQSLKRDNQNHDTRQHQDTNPTHQPNQQEEPSEIKDQNLNELELLKKKLRNNLRLKQEAASAISKKQK